MKMKIIILIFAVSWTFYVQALKVHQPTDFTGNIITNISVVYAGTGVFSYVPEAVSYEPVPYWQMTNEINSAEINPVVSVASGECDTNRLDVLFGTNYTMTSICIWQDSTDNQMVFLYKNGVQFDSVFFNTATASKTFSVSLQKFDRLGVASSNINNVVNFCFQGRKD